MNIKVDTEELKYWKAIAELEGLTLSSWIRHRCHVPNAAERTHNLAEFKANAPKIGDTVAIKMPLRYLAQREHDKTCQCGICDFRRQSLK